MSSAVVSLRGRDVLIEEGDLIATRSRSFGSRFIALFNQGAGHVVTAVRVDGALVAVGVCSSPWRDCAGRVWPAGITKEPLSLFDDPIYLDAWVVKPRVPRDEAQNTSVRMAVAQLCKRDDHSGSIYDSPREFVASLMGWRPATRNRYHCAELAAWLASQAGCWPSAQTTSCDIPTLVQTIGVAQKVF